MKTAPQKIGPWVRKQLRRKTKCAKKKHNPVHVRSFYRCEKKRKFMKSK